MSKYTTEQAAAIGAAFETSSPTPTSEVIQRRASGLVDDARWVEGFNTMQTLGESDPAVCALVLYQAGWRAGKAPRVLLLNNETPLIAFGPVVDAMRALDGGT